MVRMKPHRNNRAGAYVLPNLLTTFNLVCGIVAILLCLGPVPGLHPTVSAAQLHSSAAWFIMAAMIFDYLDGKVARWAKATSEFGVKIDSLTDFLSFGLAPMVLVDRTLLAGVPGWLRYAACGLYLLAGAWRLARFNLGHPLPGNQSSFTGLPIPAAASFLCAVVLNTLVPEKPAPLFLGHAFSTLPPDAVAGLSVVALVSLAGLMISRIPFPAFKQIDRRQVILFLGVGFFAIGLLLVLPPPSIVLLIMLLYIAFGLFQHFLQGVLRQRRNVSGWRS